MSWKSKLRYIDPRTGFIKTNVLSKDADPLPTRHRKIKSFKDSFGRVNHFEYDFKGYFVVVDVKYAFEHFQKNNETNP